MMSEPSNEQDRALQSLSALTDGECEPGQLLSTCEAWRRDGELRAAWHAYALIGDVMRSEDLASPAARDQDFLQKLRLRLADEPVVLAPAAPLIAEPYVESLQLEQQPVRRVAGGARVSSRRRWAASAAVAAGFVVVTGATVVLRGTGSPGQTLVVAPPIETPVGPRGNNGGGNAVASADSEALRNAAVERYLNAHRQFTQGPALAAPGGVRQVALTPSGR